MNKKIVLSEDLYTEFVDKYGVVPKTDNVNDKGKVVTNYGGENKGVTTLDDFEKGATSGNKYVNFQKHGVYESSVLKEKILRNEDSSSYSDLNNLSKTPEIVNLVKKIKKVLDSLDDENTINTVDRLLAVFMKYRDDAK